MTGNASDAEQTPGMETESGAAESGWLGQRKRGPKGAPNVQPRQGTICEVDTTWLRDPEGPPKVGTQMSLFLKSM